MRPMKNSPHTAQCNSHARPGAIADFRTTGDKHGLDIAPEYVGSDGIFKNRLQRASMLRSHATL